MACTGMCVYFKYYDSQMLLTFISFVFFQLVNLCANDGQRLFDVWVMGAFAVSGVAALVGSGYAVYLLGWWGLLGFFIFFLFLPLQVIQF